MPATSTHDFPALRQHLLAWFAAHHRVLPWRVLAPGQANPYHVLVSETMLQQTQVATVIDYFHRFTAALPTLAHLAAAEEQEVLRLWQGLGYYRRARHLHAAARGIMQEFGGVIPTDAAVLRTLPGIGRYTAGAIASIGGGRPEPVVDGNVARVLARWWAIGDPIDAPAVTTTLWKRAAEALDPVAPGNFNQAVMELGALICTPRNPQCAACPVAEHCRARAQGAAETIPLRLPRQKPLAVTHHVLALERRGRFLIMQRPDTGLWSAMWQLPTCEQGPGDAAGLAAWAAKTTGLDAAGLVAGERFTHQTTHRTITFQLWCGQVAGGRTKPGAGIWRRPADTADLPLAVPQRRLLAALAASRRRRPEVAAPRHRRQPR